MSPWLVRSVISPSLERLMGRRTFGFCRELTDSQWWPRERLRELQLRKVRRLVRIAANRTSFYADWAGIERDWVPESLDELKRLPLIDKATMSAHREELTDHGVPGGAIRYNTGGSSGEPLIFYLDKRRQAYDKAARMRAHDWWGLRPGGREAYIWGSPVELSKQDRLKRFRDWLTNEMLLSAFEISEGSIGRLVERIRRFRPKCLFGYPSSIALTCQLARRAGLDLRDLGVKVVFCTAEVLYDRQKQIITESTGAEVANGYGSREGGFISHECPHGGMHMTAENIIVELIKDGRPAAAGEDGEIVVTHLDNHAMPFIRYRTGDVAQSSDAQCPCGRPLPLMREIKGRSTDFILTPDGRWMHGLGLVYVMRDIVGVQEYQIVQSDVDAITVRLVTDDHFPASGESRIRQGIATAMGGEVDVSIDFVTEIQRSASGKFRYVISEVARDREKSL